MVEHVDEDLLKQLNDDYCFIENFEESGQEDDSDNDFNPRPGYYQKKKRKSKSRPRSEPKKRRTSSSSGHSSKRSTTGSGEDDGQASVSSSDQPKSKVTKVKVVNKPKLSTKGRKASKPTIAIVDEHGLFVAKKIEQTDWSMDSNLELLTDAVWDLANH